MIHYPDTDCEIHCDVRTEEAVCLICLIEDRDRHRELEYYSNLQAAQIRKKNNKIEQLQARVKEMEAIKLGLTKTLIEMEAEKARLVEALEEALHHVIISPDPVRGDFIQEIEAALDAHLKKGSEQ